MIKKICIVLNGRSTPVLWRTLFNVKLYNNNNDGLYRTIEGKHLKYNIKSTFNTVLSR